jgi:polyisoprenyl-phosphate glycosyltransferase
MGKQESHNPPKLTVVTPAYNEVKNLPLLHERLVAVLGQLDISWEWIIVDDHSTDNTFSAIKILMMQDSRIHGLRFAKNSGSHTAISCGLQYAAGRCAVVIAADLQDPPETINALLEEWQKGVQIVWAARGQRIGEKKSTIGFSRLYFFLMRHLVGIKEMPATGSDVFLLDRLVIEAINLFDEKNINIAALLTWMGFKQTTVTYDKQARLHGSSGWSLRKKIKIVIDSIVSFSYLPIRFMTIIGFVVSMLGFIYAIIVAIRAVSGIPLVGWASLMVAVLVMGGLQMIMMGILGEYLWRSLDESRNRPRYLIEDFTDEELLKRRLKKA